ncbi:MAG: dTDP-4-dehydrorhamnose 3,5-epimerase [Bauldia sp.]
MQFTVMPLTIPDVVVISTRPIADARGHFVVVYELNAFREFGLPVFVQDNQALSHRRGTIRGLHYQTEPHAQAKLIRVLRGAIFDVAVDLRRSSPTFGKWVSATLTAESGDQLFVPKGFAHGYCTLEDATEVAYRCDDFYAPRAEAGVHFADPALAIPWPVSLEAAILADKDRALPKFADAATFGVAA